MFCEHCGEQIASGNTCPNCGNTVISNQYANSNSSNLKSTRLLIFTIIELLCINPIFGLIALILYFTSLQPAIKSGNLELAQQKKKTIKTLLIIGLVIGIGIILLAILSYTLIIAAILPTVDTTSTVTESAINDIKSLQSIMKYN